MSLEEDFFILAENLGMHVEERSDGELVVYTGRRSNPDGTYGTADVPTTKVADLPT